MQPKRIRSSPNWIAVEIFHASLLIAIRRPVFQQVLPHHMTRIQLIELLLSQSDTLLLGPRARALSSADSLDGKEINRTLIVTCNIEVVLCRGWNRFQDGHGSMASSIVSGYSTRLQKQRTEQSFIDPLAREEGSAESSFEMDPGQGDCL